MNPETSSASAESKEIILAGRPNSGKSTLFNRISNGKQRVANFAGCTVEKKTSPIFSETGNEFLLTDLPGLYSLQPTSQDEEVALSHLKSQKDKSHVVFVLDGNNLKQELTLPLMLKDLGYDLSIAVNMMDEVTANRKMLDLAGMKDVVGVPFFPISARTGDGVDALKKFIFKKNSASSIDCCAGAGDYSQAHTAELFERAKATSKRAMKFQTSEDSENRLLARDLRWDSILMHRAWGPLIFFAVMFLVFQSVFAGVAPLTNLVQMGISFLQDKVNALTFLPQIVVSSLSDGLLAGVGAVLVFVPQIAVLFLMIGFLEYSGYLPRMACMVDRALRPYGLEGKAFIPLLSSVACAVPGIMATRTIENQRSRLLTILISPLMTCSARLPVYTLLISTFVPRSHLGFMSVQGLVMFGMFMLGVVTALLVAMVLHKSGLFSSKQKVDFIYLPHYRRPNWPELFRYVKMRVIVFLKKAGTIIAGMSVLLWVLLSFPKNQSTTETFAAAGDKISQNASLSAEEKTAQQELLDHQLSSQRLQESIGGQLGVMMEPLFRPLGFDWRLTIGIISSLAAREVFVSTLGTVFALGDKSKEDTTTLTAALLNAKNEQGAARYTLATCLSLLVFFAFSLQCISTIGVTRRETNSWKIPAAMFLYMFCLAYVSSFVVYHVASHFL